MKVLVTGGMGFIGSNFVRYLLAKYDDIQVVNLDRLSIGSNPANLKDLEKDQRYRFVEGSIADFPIISKLVDGVDTIVNIAAETHVDRSIADPIAFFKSNTDGVLTILEAVRENGRKAQVVQVSCYDEKTRALTLEGFKTFDQLKERDKVLSLNPKSREIEVKCVKKVIIQHYEGKMIHFRNKRVDLLVTPNHNMFIFNTSKKLAIEPVGWRKMKNISK